MAAHDGSSDAGLPLTPALPTVPLPQAHTTSAVVPTLAEPSLRHAGGRPKFYPALDGYRAFAVLLVFSVHYLSNELPLLRNWGFMGVDFFFVLSGFLITGILYDSRHQVHRLRDFYARRILRIFPLYYGVLLCLLLLWPIFRWQTEPGQWLWVGHLGNWARFLVFNPFHADHLDAVWATRNSRWLSEVHFGHFWSLCIEEQFYLVWPLVVFLIASRKRLLILCAAIIAMEPLLRFALYTRLPAWLVENDVLLRGTIFRLDALLMGAAIALLLRGPREEWLHRHGRLLSVLFALPLAAVVLEFHHRTHAEFVNLHDIAITTVGLSAAPLFGAALLLELIRPGSPLARVFSWRPLARLGQVSYGFYVFHDLPHGLYRHAAQQLSHTNHGVNAVTGAIAFVATLGLSLLSFRYYETPFLKLKSHFSHQVHFAPPS